MSHEVSIGAMLDELENPRRDLTDWEEEFIDSIHEQYVRLGELSPKQEEILARIHKEKA